MDAVQFIKEKYRMCWSHTSKCEGCPIDERKKALDFVGNCWKFEEKEPGIFVEEVSNWSLSHPLITNAMKFKEVFGKEHVEGSKLTDWWEQEYQAPEVESQWVFT